MLTDNTFRPMSRMSVEVGKAGNAQPVSVDDIVPSFKYAHVSGQFLFFPCGVIRGALAGLGVEATVVAETGAGGGGVGGGAVFQIKVLGGKS